MPSLFDGIYGIETVNEIYDKMEANYSGFPEARSGKLWLRQRECKIAPHNTSPETMLEKAVAMLAERDHMPGWYNQCPVASGIVGSRSDKRSAVDLVHWSESSRCARLVEMKWDSDDPPSAFWQVLKYGVAYIFCRIHRRELPLQERSLMDARNIALEIVAPRQYFDGNYKMNNKVDVKAWRNRWKTGETDKSATIDGDPVEIADLFAKTSQSLDEFARSKTGGMLSMSLNALAFPEDFNQVPFENGQDVRKKCDTLKLSSEGQMVRDAFAALTPAWPPTEQ